GQGRSPRSANVMVEDGKGAERVAVAREQGTSPDRANSVCQHEVTVVVPDGVGEDVGGIHRLPPIDGGAAGCARRRNSHWPYVVAKAGKTGRRSAAEKFSVLVREPDRTEHAIALRFDQTSDDRQHLGQRRSRENQLENVKD